MAFPHVQSQLLSQDNVLAHVHVHFRHAHAHRDERPLMFRDELKAILSLHDFLKHLPVNLEAQAIVVIVFLTKR